MDIGIIFYSYSGHTLELARHIENSLTLDRHNVRLHKLETVKPLKMGATTAELAYIPEIENYDVVLLGTPVRGGVPSPPMLTFLRKSPSFAGKAVICFATGFFRSEWGRDQTLALMKEICEDKQGHVLGTASVRWFSLLRRRQLKNVINTICTLIKNYQV
jgi:flavodoxin